MRDNLAHIRILSVSEGGFTLVEVLVAMLITLVALLGLLKSMQMVTETNLKNQMREEAVNLGAKQLNGLMATSFDSAGADAFVNYSARSALRSLTGKYYLTSQRVPISTSNSKMALVTVHWRFKNMSTTLAMSSVKSQ